jgi:hypothetical protein
MTSSDRDLGRLEGKVDAMASQWALMEAKIDKMISGDCVTGKANKEEIGRLDGRVKKIEFTMAKAIGMGLFVAAGGHGAAELIKVWL